MQIGVLECGPVPDSLTPKWGSYAAFFQRLLDGAGPGMNCTAFAVHEGDIPAAPDAMAGWILTGSRHGAYDDLPWIAPLEAFLRETYAARIPIAGICFGHQILAQALGGRVIKSPKGWGLGVAGYDVGEAPAWMADAPARLRFNAVHQDQVVDLPPDTHVLAGSDFCPFGMLAYGDADAPRAITIQPHPEFDRDFMADLIDAREGRVFDPRIADSARATLAQGTDNARFATWIYNFFSGFAR